MLDFRIFESVAMDIASWNDGIQFDEDLNVWSFICPECGKEIIYEEWQDENLGDFTHCPFCNGSFF